MNSKIAPRDFWSKQEIIPVVVIDSIDEAVPLAKKLIANSMARIEITLRTKAALGAIEKIRTEVPEAMVGAGTIVNAQNYQDALSAGAQFLVSPGSTPEIRQLFGDAPVPTLPGCATVSEAMELSNLGFEVAKFYPAMESGGVATLKAFASVLPNLGFCPTGGLTASNYREFLALPNVVCVGGSWVTK